MCCRRLLVAELVEVEGGQRGFWTAPLGAPMCCRRLLVAELVEAEGRRGGSRKEPSRTDRNDPSACGRPNGKGFTIRRLSPG